MELGKLSPFAFAENASAALALSLDEARKAGREGSSLYAEALRRLRKNKMAMISAAFLVFMIVVCYGSWFFPLKPWDIENFLDTMAAPSMENWFGTDEAGRDLFARVLFGGRVTLTVGIVTSAVSVTIGILAGAISGYMGGWIDHVLMWIVNFMYSLPFYFIQIMIMVFFKLDSIFAFFVILGLFMWLGMARIVRGQILSLRERDFVLALRSCGVPTWRIILFHMIPNVLGIVVVYATLTIPGVMLSEAFLSYIGITFKMRGTDGRMLPVASWGTLISEGIKTLETAPWLLGFPALLFTLTLLAINFLGDGLRDAFDPNMKS